MEQQNDKRCPYLILPLSHLRRANDIQTEVCVVTLEVSTINDQFTIKLELHSVQTKQSHTADYDTIVTDHTFWPTMNT